MNGIDTILFADALVGQTYYVLDSLQLGNIKQLAGFYTINEN